VCDFGGPTEQVHLVGVSISFEKNFYRLPFTPPLSGRLIGPSRGRNHEMLKDIPPTKSPRERPRNHSKKNAKKRLKKSPKRKTGKKSNKR
jgi:hypothetical protein